MSNPTCVLCHKSVKVLTVKNGKPENFGRKFAKCCGKFQWLDSPVVTGAIKTDSVQPVNQKEEKELIAPITTGGFLSDTPVGFASEPSAPAVVKKEFAPSRYQQDVYSAIQNGDSNLVVIASPGSGKTTTIKNAAPYLPQGKNIVAVAFNKKNANELGAVMPDWVQCMTLHSLGLKAIRKAFGKVEIDDRKVYNLLRDYQDERVQDNAPAINQLVSLCQNTLREPTVDNLSELCNYYGVSLNGDSEYIFGIVKQVYNANQKQTKVVSFDDMINFPALGIVPCEKQDRILVDETQDLNAAQIAQVLNSITSDGFIYAVGDPLQSLYGFRGADVDAVEKVTAALNAKTLPLSISYRLPLSHVKQLNDLFPDAKLEARADAPEGLIANLPGAELYRKVEAGSMVICRTNAPLIEPCFELIRRGIKATIAGRDIGKNLIALLRKMQKRAGTNGMHQVLYTMQDYVSREVSKLVSMHKENQALSLRDACDTLIALSDGCQHLSELELKINGVFSDDVQGVVFSSIHRCKGLESDKVFLLHRELIPHPMARQVWQVKQEQNCLFVALSRSKSELYFVS